MLSSLQAPQLHPYSFGRPAQITKRTKSRRNSGLNLQSTVPVQVMLSANVEDAVEIMAVGLCNLELDAVVAGDDIS